MNVLQHTRNERNPCLKQSRLDRSYGDTLVSALLQINAHPLGHNVKQVPPSNKKTPLPLSLFQTSGDARKTCFCYHFIYNFYASSTSESVQENSKFPFFLCTTLVTRRKTSFSLSLPSTKLTISLFHLQVILSLATPKIFIFSVRTVLQETKINISQ